MDDVRLSDDVAEAAIIHPGDTLIIRVPTNTMRDHAMEMAGSIKRGLIDVEVLVIAAEEIAVYRPETGE